MENITLIYLLYKYNPVISSNMMLQENILRHGKMSRIGFNIKRQISNSIYSVNLFD